MNYIIDKQDGSRKRVVPDDLDEMIRSGQSPKAVYRRPDEGAI